MSFHIKYVKMVISDVKTRNFFRRFYHNFLQIKYFFTINTTTCRQAQYRNKPKRISSVYCMQESKAEPQNQMCNALRYSALINYGMRQFICTMIHTLLRKTIFNSNLQKSNKRVTQEPRGRVVTRFWIQSWRHNSVLRRMRPASFTSPLRHHVTIL